MVVSKNGVALIVMVISLLGGDVSETDLATTVSVIGQIVSIALMAWNQYARPNVKNFIFKE
jgi:hypothetical protein